jgi:arginyl-tRNA--protein-N-Asp/Glu arginylyltransferase
MRYYHLSEMVISCSKVNYKMNYRPGMVICPRTKGLVYYDEVKEMIELYASLPH